MEVETSYGNERLKTKDNGWDLSIHQEQNMNKAGVYITPAFLLYQ
jgi:hypothetical protein